MRKLSLDYVYKLACQDERVVYIGSDVGVGTLDEFKRDFPERFFMEGIAEQHIIGMAAGLALEGYIPYVNTIATFLTRRCYEQLAIDVCLHNLPIRLIANGGGLVYAPLGPTHLAIDDIALMRSLPNMQIAVVADEEEMKHLMCLSLDIVGPLYVRVSKGNEPIVYKDEYGFKFGKASIWKDTNDILIISTGVMTHDALKIAEQCEHVGIMHMHTIKPLDHDAILHYARKVKQIIILEEHIRSGGLGTAVLECLHDSTLDMIPRVKRFGINDRFPHGYGSQRQMIDHEIADINTVVNYIKQTAGIKAFEYS